MNEQEFILMLWRTGQFWKPNSPNAANVKESDLPTLTLNDKAVIEAARNFQMSDANITPLVQRFHARAPIFDGGVGPATMALAALDRCPIPDVAPPKNATFTYDDPDLQRAVEKMQAATGSGSWPHGCYGTSGVHEVKISYDLRALSAKHREWWPEIQKRSHEAVAAIGVKLIEVPVGEKANITVYGRVLGGSVIGMAEFNSGACGDTVFCQLNPNYAPSVEMVTNLLLHENGHNWNLEHRSGNIMNPSILSTPNYWVKRDGGALTYQDNSYPTLKRFFGGEQIPGGGGPFTYGDGTEKYLKPTPTGSCDLSQAVLSALKAYNAVRPRGNQGASMSQTNFTDQEKQAMAAIGGDLCQKIMALPWAKIIPVIVEACPQQTAAIGICPILTTLLPLFCPQKTV